MMRKCALLMIAVCAVLAAGCAKDSEPLRGIVDFIAGDVALVSGDRSTPVLVGDAVTEGMQLRTGANSYVRISFGGDQLQVYEKTVMDFSALSRLVKKERQTMEMALEKGTVLCRVALKVNKGDSFRVSSGTMVAAVRGTEFLYGVEDGRGVVACYRGVVSVRRAGSDEEVILHEGEMLTIESGRKMKSLQIPAGYRYRDFESGKNSYEDRKGASDRGSVTPAVADRETAARASDRRETAGKKSRTRDAGDDTAAKKGGSELKDTSRAGEKKSAATGEASKTSKKEGGASTAAKKETAAAKKGKDTTAVTGKKGGSEMKDMTAAEEKKTSGAGARKKSAPAGEASRAAKKETAADATAPDSGKKGKGKQETAGETGGDAKKKAVSPETTGERKPGGLLTKPRVDEPEAK